MKVFTYWPGLLHYWRTAINSWRLLIWGDDWAVLLAEKNKPKPLAAPQCLGMSAYDALGWDGGSSTRCLAPALPYCKAQMCARHVVYMCRNHNSLCVIRVRA